MMRVLLLLAAVALSDFKAEAFDIGDTVAIDEGKFSECNGIVVHVGALFTTVRLDCKLCPRNYIFHGIRWKFNNYVPGFACALKLEDASPEKAQEIEEMEEQARNPDRHHQEKSWAEPHSFWKKRDKQTKMGKLDDRAPDPNALAPSNTPDVHEMPRSQTGGWVKYWSGDVSTPSPWVNHEKFDIEVDDVVFIQIGRYSRCSGTVMQTRRVGASETEAKTNDGQDGDVGDIRDYHVLVKRNCPKMPGHGQTWWYTARDVFKKEALSKDPVKAAESERKLTANLKMNGGDAQDQDAVGDAEPEVSWQNCRDIPCKVGEELTLKSEDAYEGCTGKLARIAKKTGSMVTARFYMVNIHCKPEEGDDEAESYSEPGDMDFPPQFVTRLFNMPPALFGKVDEGKELTHLSIPRDTIKYTMFVHHTDMFYEGGGDKLTGKMTKTQGKKHNPYFKFRDGSTMIVRRGGNFRLKIRGDPKREAEVWLDLKTDFNPQNPIAFANADLRANNKSWCRRGHDKTDWGEFIACNIPSTAPIGEYNLKAYRPFKKGVMVTVLPCAQYPGGGQGVVKKAHPLEKSKKDPSLFKAATFNIQDEFDDDLVHTRVPSYVIRMSMRQPTEVGRRSVKVIVLFNAYNASPQRKAIGGNISMFDEYFRKLGSIGGKTSADTMLSMNDILAMNDPQPGGGVTKKVAPKPFVPEVIKESEADAAARSSLLQVESEDDSGSEEESSSGSGSDKAVNPEEEEESGNLDNNTASGSGSDEDGSGSAEEEADPLSDTDAYHSSFPKPDPSDPPVEAASKILGDDLWEYLENQRGLLFKGFHDDQRPVDWHFDQFNSISVAAALKTLDGLSTEERSNPVSVTRHLSFRMSSRVCKHRMGGGSYSTSWGPRNGYVCAGFNELRRNWNRFKAQRCTDPSKWESSSVLFRQHLNLERSSANTENPVTRVQYCHDYNLAALMVTMGRTLGIPSRVVTGYNIGHDMNGDRAITKWWSPPAQDNMGGGPDRVRVWETIDTPICPKWCFDDDVAELEHGCKNLMKCLSALNRNNGHKVWDQCKQCTPCAPCLTANEHVWYHHSWAEMHFKRLDLHEKDDMRARKVREVQGKYDGWQMLDPTPQEYSAYDFKNGPSSVKKMRTGKQDCFDGSYNIAATNGNVKLMLAYDGGAWYPEGMYATDPFTKSSTIGQVIVTKKPSLPTDPKKDACHGQMDVLRRNCSSHVLILTDAYKRAPEPVDAGQATKNKDCSHLDLMKNLAPPNKARQYIPWERTELAGRRAKASIEESYLSNPSCELYDPEFEDGGTPDQIANDDLFFEGKLESRNGTYGEYMKKLGNDVTESMYVRTIGHMPQKVTEAGDVWFKSKLFKEKGPGSHFAVMGTKLPLKVSIENRSPDIRTVHCLWRSKLKDFDGRDIVWKSEEQPDGSLKPKIDPLVRVLKKVVVPAGASAPFSTFADLQSSVLDKRFSSFRENGVVVSITFSAMVEETGETYIFEGVKELIEGSENPLMAARTRALETEAKAKKAANANNKKKGKAASPEKLDAWVKLRQPGWNEGTGGQFHNQDPDGQLNRMRYEEDSDNPKLATYEPRADADASKQWSEPRV